MSSLSFEECAHKMLQMTIKPGQEVGGATNCGSQFWCVCPAMKEGLAI